MKTKHVFGAALCVLLPCVAKATLLYDDFSAPALDTSLWQVQTPLGDSQMYASDGNAVFFQRGTLTTQQALPTAVQISGRFAFTGGTYDIFDVMWRTDGALHPDYEHFMNGTLAHFALRGGDDGDKRGLGNIALNTGAGQTIGLGLANFLFQMNTYYDFKIIDDGYNVQLFLQDMTTPLLSGSTTYSAGQLLGIQNRGYVPWWPLSDNEVRLDYISVSAIPEPSTYIAAALLLLPFGFSFIRSVQRKQAA